MQKEDTSINTCFHRELLTLLLQTPGLSSRADNFIGKRMATYCSNWYFKQEWLSIFHIFVGCLHFLFREQLIHILSHFSTSSSFFSLMIYRYTLYIMDMNPVSCIFFPFFSVIYILTLLMLSSTKSFTVSCCSVWIFPSGFCVSCRA